MLQKKKGLVRRGLSSLQGHIPKRCLSYTLLKPNLCLTYIAINQGAVKTIKALFRSQRFLLNHGKYRLPNIAYA